MEEIGGRFRVGWFDRDRQAVRVFDTLAEAVTDYLLFSFGKGRLSPSRPARAGATSLASVIAGAVGFVVAAIAGFYAIVFAWIRFNTVPRDETSQGIMGSVFALVVALPLGICAGVGGAIFAARLTRRLLQGAHHPPPNGEA